MSNEQRVSSFDELVAGISAEERKFLLAKINQNREETLPILQPLREDVDEFTLDIKLRSESILYKFFLWLRSLITHTQKIELYNQDLIGTLARKINKSHPGIIDQSNGLLQSLFYEKLKELKASADFFKPYFQIFAENPGKFYVFLSTFIAPDISAAITKDADPYSVPFEREATVELRASLLKRLDGILKDIPQNSRTRLYESVKALLWLKRFSALSYTHFLAQFTAIISENYTCPYTNAQTDFPSLAEILCEAKPIPNNALEALFLFPQRKGGAAVELDGETEKSMRDFLSKAASSISMIQMFISTVPMAAIGKVIFSDYDWQVDQFGGGEDWFLKFKEQWKVIFDERWESWLRDRKKAQLADKLREKFGVDSFPELPHRPWTKLWGGQVFRCELTGGFLYWFATNKYDEIMSVLNILVLEGVFNNNENRAELSEALNKFADINHQVALFGESLAESGSIGNVFAKVIAEHVRTLKGQNMIDSVILNAETNIRNWEAAFCEACRSIERVLQGILDEAKDRNYESIQNLSTIRGHENREYRDKLDVARDELDECRKILAEIEPLDLPKNEKKSTSK